MQKAVRQILICILMCCLFSVSWSLPLNEARVPVADRSAGVFATALPLAYKQVLIKLSANPAIMSIQQVADSVVRAQEYLTSYSYQKAENSALGLHVVFDEAAIKALLEGVNQRVWEGERSPTLILLSMQTEAGQNVISSLQDSPLISVLQTAAKDRGLRVIFPVMDLEDQSVLVNQQGEQTNMNFTPFMDRYQVKSVLFGKVVLDADNQYHIAWTMALGNTQNQWSSENTDITNAIAVGMDKLLETLANHYASIQSTKALANVFLEVDGINGLRDYVKVVSAVRHLHNVKAVSVKDMNLKSLVLQVKVAGGAEALVGELSHSNNLTPLSSTNEEGASTENLVYQWVQSKPLPANSAHVYMRRLYLPDDAQDQVTTEPYHATQQLSRISS